ncbi:MAG: C25 family cysteine peptidase, partial [Candidatus Dormibacteria bacterium]
MTLTALEGDNDVSLVQSIALHYPHTYTADANYLRSTVPSGDTVTLRGFTNPGVMVFDITNPEEITELTAPAKIDGASYDVTLEVPGSAAAGTQTLLALSADQISAPAALAFHPPSTLTEQRRGADIVIITHPEFEASLAPLVQLRERQGHEVALVTVDQIFDAFSYGERTPFAIRNYLQWAAAEWREKPQALLLAGDASVDPRNYLG